MLEPELKSCKPIYMVQSADFRLQLGQIPHPNPILTPPQPNIK